MIGRSLNAGCSSFRADAGLIVRSSPTSATLMDSSLPALSIHLDHPRTCQVPSRTEGVVLDQHIRITRRGKKGAGILSLWRAASERAARLLGCAIKFP